MSYGISGPEQRLNGIAEDIRRLVAARDTADYYVGKLLVEARDVAGPQVAEWARQEFGMSPSRVSKLIKVAQHVPERYSDRGLTALYTLYRAHEETGLDWDELASAQDVLSASDFKTEYLGAAPIEDVPVCDVTGRRCRWMKGDPT